MASSSIATMNSALPVWCIELTTYGYHRIRRPPPNNAVQTVLSCILRNDLHEYILEMERAVPNSESSAIIHLGFSNFLDLVAGFAKAEYDIIECKRLIDSKYTRLPMIQYNAIAREATYLRTFVRGLTALERANGVKFTFPPNTRRVRPRAAAAPEVRITSNVLTNNCLFNVNMLPEEYRSAYNTGQEANNVANNVANNEENNADEERLPINGLNLFNCGRFPIMTQRKVESHAAQYKQAIWKSKNLGVLAPINLNVWKQLGGINDEDIKTAYHDADKMIRKVDKVEIALPFSAKCFGLEYSNSNKIFIGQKSHQARLDERRHDFYIKKMWRTLCPYIKCTCTKIAKETGECTDTIIWLDHAIWFLINNLEKAWPTQPNVIRFGYLCSILSTPPIKTATIAFIGYLRVRDMLINMTVKFADDPNSDLNSEFGNTVLSDILEKTIKPIKFMINKQQEMEGSCLTDGSRKRTSEPSSPDCSVIMPPKLYARPESVNSKNSAVQRIIDIEDSNTNEGSVTKTGTSGNGRSYDISTCNLAD